MKKIIVLVVLFIFFHVSSPVYSDSVVKAVYGETYICGDSFEITIQSEPIFTTEITRHASWERPVLAKAGFA